MIRFFCLLVLAFCLTGPRHVAARDTIEQAAFEDENAEELVGSFLRARAARNVPRDSYQTLLTNRQRVGFLIPNQWFWRDRTLLHKEIAALMDFYPTDPKPSAIVGKTRGAPMVGNRILDNKAWFNKFGFDPERESPSFFGLLSFSIASLARDLPLSGAPEWKLFGFDSTWVDPLSDAGLEHYTYRTGRILASSDSTLQNLLAVEVRSRDADMGDLVGAIWFDQETGQPVRAMYRPMGRWKVSAGFRGFARAVPIVPKNALAQVDFFTIDYGYDVPPRAIRALLYGAMYWFYDQAILPVEMEWSMDWDESYETEVAKRALAESGGGIHKQPDGTWPVSPDSTFGATWLVPNRIQPGSGFNAPLKALRPFIRELDWIAGKPPAQGIGRTLGSAVGSVRFNQVQGVNFTIRYPWYVGPRSTIDMRATLATSGFQPTAVVEYRKERKPLYWNASVYSRLNDADRFERVNGVFSSLTAILSGYDDGNYYLAEGASVGGGIRQLPLTLRAELFVESQSAVEKTETYSLFGPPDPPPPPGLIAESGTIGGIRVLLNVQFGDDPQRRVVVGRLFGEAAAGDFNYFSIGTMNDIVIPLFWRLAGAARFTLGYAGGEVPTQAEWYLGGVKTVRGYAANSASGDTAYILRLEVGSDVPLARLVLFGDAGAAASPGQLYKEEPLVAVGAGISLFDGVVRVDFAQGLTLNGTFRVLFSTSGLF